MPNIVLVGCTEPRADRWREAVTRVLTEMGLLRDSIITVVEAKTISCDPNRYGGIDPYVIVRDTDVERGSEIAKRLSGYSIDVEFQLITEFFPAIRQ